MLAAKGRKNAWKTVFFIKKRRKLQNFLNISSSYAKILGETNCQPRKFLWSGTKAKDRKLVITMASYALQRNLGRHTQSRLSSKEYLHLTKHRRNFILVTVSGTRINIYMYFTFCETLNRMTSLCTVSRSYPLYIVFGSFNEDHIKCHHLNSF